MKTLTNITINPSFELRGHSVARLQKKCEGAAIIPTPKSATAKDTTNALVLVRSWRLLQTMKMINPFTTIVRMLRNQLRTQNHVSIQSLLNICLGLFNFFLRSSQEVLKGFKDEKRNCVYVEFLINHMAPSNLRKS